MFIKKDVTCFLIKAYQLYTMELPVSFSSAELYQNIGKF